jgi:hypothetical protein
MATLAGRRCGYFLRERDGTAQRRLRNRIKNQGGRLIGHPDTAEKPRNFKLAGVETGCHAAHTGS